MRAQTIWLRVELWPDAALPVAVLQPLTEERLLAIAQPLYSDLAAHMD